MIDTTYLVSASEVEAALARDGMALADYDRTVFGLINDGGSWHVFEDSMEPDEAWEWARRAESYGEWVGLFVWRG